MKREALEKLNRRGNELLAERAGAHSGTVTVQCWHGFDTVVARNQGLGVEGS